MADDTDANANLCWVCNAEVGSAHQCFSCKNFVHIFCGELLDSEDEGYGQKLTCDHCLKQKDTPVTPPTSVPKEKQNAWSAFKRVSLSSCKNPVAKKQRKEKDGPSKSINKEIPDPHICLECGSEISRGRDYNKKRHWMQKHPEKPLESYAKQIVPKNHEFARKRLAEIIAKETGALQVLETNTPSTFSPNVNEAGSNKANISNDERATDSSSVSIQRSLHSSMVTKEKPEVSLAEQIQGDINRILVMLESLTLPEKSKKQGEVHVSHDVTAVITASNLLEVKHPDVVVDILEDGCKVTCYPCQQFQLAQPKKNLWKAHSSWGNGLVFNKEKTEQLIIGKNQQWYNLKKALIEHLGCSSIRSGGQEHFKAMKYRMKEQKTQKRINDVNTNIVSAAIQVCKMKSAGLSYEHLIGFLSTCGADIGDIGHGRNQFPEVIATAYHYAIMQTKKFLKTPLESTGLRPHISLAVDKSTPHRDTNHAILILLPVNGRRIAMPLDAPPVYSIAGDSNEIEGGTGQDLAEQVANTMRDKLEFDNDDMHYVRAVHADGQYQSSTFQHSLFAEMGKVKELDEFFLTSWDVSHWIDLAMVRLREETCSLFMKRLIKRANRFHTMFAHGRGHVEYKGLASSLGLKALETVTFSTTRFFSSSYEQWEKIYLSYKALVESFRRSRENDDDEEETKYQVRGEDFVVDLCGVLDIVKPVVSLMIRAQAVNLPPWKIVTWYSQVKESLKRCEADLKKVEAGAKPSKEFLAKLSEHWDEIFDMEKEDEDERQPGTFQGVPLLFGWLVVDQTTEINDGKKKTTYNWAARSPKDCIPDLIAFCQNLQIALDARFNLAVPAAAQKLYQIFDLEKACVYMEKFRVEGGKLVVSREDRIKWETAGTKEFQEFYNIVCNIPHVQALADTNRNLSLLPHDSNAILKKFKTTIEKILWFGLGDCLDNMFVDQQGNPVEEFNESNLLSLTAVRDVSLDQLFELEFASDVKVKAKLNEENLVASFYNNQVIYESLGQEMCIALDIALATGGCEAIVEGFYSVVSAHKKCGGQSNNVLVQRAIVDWTIPDPISCPNTMKEIARLYTDGSKKLGIAKHRLPVFFDERQRAAAKHHVSKVVDRLKSATPRCPHIIQADVFEDIN